MRPCFRTLVQHDSSLRITLLEAGSRLGGRVQTVKAGLINSNKHVGVTYFSVQSSKLSTERPVDVGAHWVGVTQHRVMDLARQFGLGRRTQYLRGTKVMQVRAYSV